MRTGLLLRLKAAGDVISAAEWNELVRYATRPITGPSVIDTPDGVFIDARPGAASSTEERRYARITEAEGSSPPFLYSGVEVTPVANGQFEDVSGGADLQSCMYNIGESVYPGAGKVPVGRVVVWWWGVTGEALFDVLWYRGTYG